MAKYLIFSNETNNLDTIADSDEKKNNFINNQTIYTALSVTDSEYEDVKMGRKTAKLVNGAASIENFPSTSSYIEQSVLDLDAVKDILKNIIQLEITNMYVKDRNDSDFVNALNSIDVDALTEKPTGTLPNWIFSQITIPFKRYFEL